MEYENTTETLIVIVSCAELLKWLVWLIGTSPTKSMIVFFSRKTKQKTNLPHRRKSWLVFQKSATARLSTSARVRRPSSMEVERPQTPLCFYWDFVFSFAPLYVDFYNYVPFKNIRVRHWGVPTTPQVETRYWHLSTCWEFQRTMGLFRVPSWRN